MNDGLKTLRVIPVPVGGSMKPVIARAMTMIISRPPVISMNLADSLIPRHWRAAVSGVKTRIVTHHSQGTSMFQFERSSPWTMNPNMPATGPPVTGE